MKSFPNKIEHTLEWAKDLAFDKQFTTKPSQLNKILEEENLVETLLNHPSGEIEKRRCLFGLFFFYFFVEGSQFAKTIKRAISMIKAKPQNFKDCVKLGRLKFEHYFANSPKQLLALFPPDHMVNGVRFWTPPKTPPMPLVFDSSNPTHLLFVKSFANLFATMWNLETNRDDATIAKMADGVEVPVFVPDKSKKVETDPEKKKEEAVTTPEPETSQKEFEEMLRMLEKLLPLVKKDLSVADFEKDDDSNFHIDFISSCGNLRAMNYGIKAVDRLEAKRIAGRIIPAIATTTSVVSGHVSLELIKLVAKANIQDHRNLNCNLALPFYLFSEPDEAPKKKLGDVSYTKWDVWDVKIGLNVTVAEVMEYFKENFNLVVQSIMQGIVCWFVFVFVLILSKGGAIIYHEDFQDDVQESMKELLEVPKGVKFVPLVVMFQGKNEGEVLAGPAIRFFIGKKKRKTK